MQWWYFLKTYHGIGLCGTFSLTLLRQFIYLITLFDVEQKGHGVVLGIKKWFDESFDGYFVEESVWDLGFW